MVTTVAGTGRSSCVERSTPCATDAALLSLGGIIGDRRGNLFIADSGRQRVRQVTPEGLSSRWLDRPSYQLPPGWP
jgi:hypothetical protein